MENEKYPGYECMFCGNLWSEPDDPVEPAKTKRVNSCRRCFPDTKIGANVKYSAAERSHGPRLEPALVPAQIYTVRKVFQWQHGRNVYLQGLDPSFDCMIFTPADFDENLKLHYFERFGLQEVVMIGMNEHGYRFGFGRRSAEWVAFAEGKTEDDLMCFYLPYLPSRLENSRENVARFAGAYPQYSEHGYGGISRWFIPEAFRGKPEDFVCAECSTPFCSGEECGA